MIETLTNNAAFLHWTLAIGITLLVLDLFCNTEVIAWIALFCFATWATLLTGVPVQWSLLIFLLYLAAAAALYYAVWSVFIRPFVVGLMLRHSPAEDDQLLIGRHGTIIGEGDDMHLRVADELWPVEEHSRASLKPGDTATITGYHNGIVTVRPQQPELGYAGPGFLDTRLTHVLLALSQGSAYHLTKPRTTHHEQPYT